MMADRQNPGLTVRSAAWRGVNFISHKASQLWSYLFPDYDTSLQIAIELTTTDGSSDRMLVAQDTHPLPVVLPLDSRIVTSTQDKPQLSLSLQYFHDGAPAGSAYLYIQNGQPVLLAREPVAAFAPVVFSSVRIRSNTEDAARLSQVLADDSARFLVEALQILEPQIQSLSVLTHLGEAMVYATMASSRSVTVALLGDGTSKFLHTLLAVATAPNGLVLIDEIENGIHYSVMPRVWKAILQAASSYNTQIFVTTHSYEMLLALIAPSTETLMEGVSFYRLERDDQGGARVIGYPAQAFTRALLADHEVR
jgi:hypothetical protein